MDADVYQRLAMRTAGDMATSDPQDALIASAALKDALIVSALGLTGEAGEVAEVVKKHVAQGHPLDRERLLLEAGDVAWYLARLCTALDVPLSEVLRRNIDKLSERYPDGFSTQASLGRKENGPTSGAS
ncbi:MAG TPA: nucleoside triphosphate pyrophosphohydrolase family protein [Ktedonobacterales bacterium]|jgi:NTP pyrophosphatase (non-canonical NTP hydrolase)|nr:nucleoside triphosphate pyrophosphohydrolase family protein [Ktedonobacterales bacterium]